MKARFFVSLVLALLACCCEIIPAHAQPPAPAAAATPAAVIKTGPVKIEPGTICGAVIGEAKDIRVFKGVPFAAPPVGDLRWAPPQPHKHWTNMRECLEYGPVSFQPKMPLPVPIAGFDVPATASEDCLYLNIWTPAKKDNEKLPVMVWIHGGGYTMGAASQALYDGEALARLGVIVVSINYRLGGLGFFAHPALTAESKNKSSGNYGILDQIEALKWVKQNIVGFGGDRDNVTIFGESAGGGSVLCLMVSPLAKGLFHRAIAESAPIMNLKHLSDSVFGYPSMEEVGEQTVEKLGLKDKKGEELLKALRALPPEAIREATSTSIGVTGLDIRGDMLRFAPIVDGWVIADDPNDVLREGKQHDVPMIVGANLDEGTMFTMLGSPVKDLVSYQNYIRKAFGEFAEDLLKQYPAKTDADVKAALNAAVRNFIFVTQARQVARDMERVKAPAYYYQFAHAAASGLGKMMGAHHGAEIPYVFNNLAMLKQPDATDEMLRKTISGYFVQFAKTGDPNKEGLPKWPEYTSKTDETLVFADEVKPVSGLYKDELDLMEKIFKSLATPAPSLESGSK